MTADDAGIGVTGHQSAQAVGQALHAFGAKRIAFATPYSPEMIGRATRYYERNFGMTVVAGESLGAADAYAIGKMDAEMVTALAALRGLGEAAEDNYRGAVAANLALWEDVR